MMKPSKMQALGVLVFIALFSLTASAQELVTETGYQIQLQHGWTRADDVPPGIDVGFRKKTGERDYAAFYFHHEVMPPEAEEPPSNTADMKRQWDAILRNQYPDVRSVTGAVPQVGGSILINGTYELTDGGKKVRRRYTYFVSGRTAFVVQCSASPTQWASVLNDFDAMLASLQPGGSLPETETKSDESARAELTRDLPTLFGSFPPQWSCALSDLAITPTSSKDTRTLEIAVSFDRPDIGEIYKATKTLFDMIKADKSDSDLKSLPVETQRAALNSGAFMKYVGQVWGLAWGYVANCNPAIERYKLAVFDSKGERVGSVTISREDGAVILTGKVTALDAKRLAGMHLFE
jgi:hypothetical protein